jgi:hypothetical protein
MALIFQALGLATRKRIGCAAPVWRPGTEIEGWAGSRSLEPRNRTPSGAGTR